MDNKMPRMSVASVLMENFKDEQVRFLISQVAFKSGIAEQGILAVNYLTSMYYILPAARYIQSEEAKATKFVNDLDGLRMEIMKYIQAHKEPGRQNFLEFSDYQVLDDKFDALVREFYKIMFKTGFSP